MIRSSSFYILPAFCMLIFLLSPFFGASPTSIPPSSDQWEIIKELRLPRVLLAILVGGGLSMTGAVLQSYFKNELASPYTLGISSAAAFGAAISIFLRLPAPFLQICSVSGAMIALGFLLVYFRARHFENLSYLLLVGLAIGLIASSGIFLLQYIGGPERSFEMYRWLTGGLEIVGFRVLIFPAVIFIFSLYLIMRMTFALDVMQVGLQFAKGRGVDVQKTGTVIIIVSSLLIGVFVSICGPIGFVGLIMPHIARKMVGASHAILIPFSVILGAGFLVFSDMLSRIAFSPLEVPVGIITSLIGGPWFLYLLVRERKG
ncbi:MAG TPA: iron ABC transporter permease [Oligoflexia bacterium]|nr:iron ABC transporter permease [Oligoflexia bacterium]HMP47332.1 iron ABC transporter permease [Oligoflexia bacterium]